MFHHQITEWKEGLLYKMFEVGSAIYNTEIHIDSLTVLNL